MSEKLKCTSCGFEWLWLGGLHEKLPDKPICQTCQQTAQVWKKERIKYFKVDEDYYFAGKDGSQVPVWGNPSMMDIKLIWMLDRIRREVGKPFIVHCGYGRRGHSPKSIHRYGQAVDFHVRGVCTNRELRSLYVSIDRMWPFGGLGVYPHWSNPGFHLDIGKYRRWERDTDGRYLPGMDGKRCKHFNAAVGCCFDSGDGVNTGECHIGTTWRGYGCGFERDEG